MESEFNYYVIRPHVTERTPLLMNDPSVDSEGTSFLFGDSRVDESYIAHLQFLMPLKNPDMDVDYLYLDTFPVFSNKVYLALQKHMPIENLQLVKAIINENGEEYNDFWISYTYRRIKSFDEQRSTYDSINRRGVWFGLERVVLDKDLLNKIPLKERLVFKAPEDVAFQLYHESVVDIIKSVNPKGMQFVPIEEWRS